MTIKNEKTVTDKHVEDLRKAIEHRATWMYLLIDEFRKVNPKDWEKLARAAIFRCGCFHGNTRFTKSGDLREFAKEFANETVRKIFEMDVVELTEDRLVIDFHYCPLVAAWCQFTQNREEIKMLCDIAMEGDRGIISTFPEFSMELQKTIAAGEGVCRLSITKKKRDD